MTMETRFPRLLGLERSWRVVRTELEASLMCEPCAEQTPKFWKNKANARARRSI